ncbi:hypothetical protein FA95DRAFT_1608277 [Auriscalpium vulgare]|uniref:Uncharacterized protein n=1 Tax=Auriscalpium vulgare TaxID=40419 RepID=A0ACB8RL15_9AGAM|nr:hypothetical protein FA95DRAFT_1608277 [Auriscalpium vulgare]
MLTLDVATLASVFVGSILYGVHVVTFGNAVKVLLFKKRRQARRPILIVATFLFFFFGTMFVAIAFRWVLDAFVSYKGPGGPIAKLLQISGVVPQLIAIPLTAQTLIGDAMLIYRCFVLYRQNWLIVVLPIMCWLGTLILGVLIVVVTSKIEEQTTISNIQLEPMILSSLGLTVAVNSFCTSMIVYKIWTMREQLQSVLSAPQDLAPKTQYGQIISVLVESTAMYSVCALLLLILEIRKSNGAYIIYHATIQVAGIAFNLVTIRIDQGRSVEAHFTQGATGNDPMHFTSGRTRTTLGEASFVDLPVGGGANLRSSEDVFAFGGGKMEEGRIEERSSADVVQLVAKKTG